MIERIGRALYGFRWSSGLSHDLGVNGRTIQRWASGADPVPAGAWREMLALVQNREGEWSMLIGDIKKALDDERDRERADDRDI